MKSEILLSSFFHLSRMLSGMHFLVRGQEVVKEQYQYICTSIALSFLSNIGKITLKRFPAITSQKQLYTPLDATIFHSQ